MSATARRRLLLAAGTVAAGVAVAAGAFLLRDDDAAPAEDARRPAPGHVHGLGIDPADGALYIATHTGLYRAPRDGRTAERVGTSLQDTMGFTVVGPRRFLASGHPDMRDAIDRDLPPLLGLIESTDGGRTWRSVSLLGQADFHVLRHTGARIYGYDASGGRLLASDDGGVTWRRLPGPDHVVDLVAQPGDRERLVVAVAGGPEQGLFASTDGGRTWERAGDAVGLLAWPAPDELYVVDVAGRVAASADGGRTFAERGEIGGEPAALLAYAESVYAALHDGTVKVSSDGGRSWRVRATP